MSKEKQIEEMAKVLCEDCARDVAPCSLNKLGRMCDSVREQAEALYNAGYRKHEWISVEERLPNPGEEVLVCDEVGDAFTDLIECDGKWGEEISRRWGIKYLYWMPLPEPPKMKGGEE